MLSLDLSSYVDKRPIEQTSDFRRFLGGEEDRLTEVGSLTIEIPRFDASKVAAMGFFRYLVEPIKNELLISVSLYWTPIVC